MKTLIAHVHACAMCSDTFECQIDACTAGEFFVCPHPACIAAWESDGSEDEEKHSNQCVCLDCSCGDWNANEQPYPSRA